MRSELAVRGKNLRMLVLALFLSSVSGRVQLPSQAMGIQCAAYTGRACAGVVDYEHFVVAGRDESAAETAVKDGMLLYKVPITSSKPESDNTASQGKIYECRAAAKRYLCAVNYPRCRSMKLPPGVPSMGVLPTFPTLPCKSLCQRYPHLMPHCIYNTRSRFQKACRVTEESCEFLSDEKCNNFEAPLPAIAQAEL